MTMFSMDKDVWIVGEEVNFTLNLEEYMEDYTYTNETTTLNIYLIKDWSKSYGQYTLSQLDSMGKLIRFNSSLYGINFKYNWNVTPSSQYGLELEQTHMITDSDKNIETLTPIIFITSSHGEVVSLNTNPINDFITEHMDSYIICDSLNVTIGSNAYWLMKDLHSLWNNNNIEYGYMDSYNSSTLLCKCNKINKLVNGTLLAFHIEPNINLSDTTNLMLKLQFRDGTLSTPYPIYGKINSTYSRELIPINAHDLLIGGVLLLVFNGTDKWIALNLERGTSLADNIYPVGSIYMSVNSTNPSYLFGGTWEQIKDTFLLATGDTYENGATGGSANAVVVKHNHTQNPHNHTQNSHGHLPSGGDSRRFMSSPNGCGWVEEEGGKISGSGHYYVSSTDSSHNVYNETIGVTVATNKEATATNKEAGEDGTGKNMPPYLAVYMWKRVG